MAGGGMAALGVKKERAAEYKGRMTLAVAMACLVAAVGGSIFGYDIGISGGVTSMDPFLEKFFPVVFRRKNSGHQNNYCKYDNQGLSAFTSSLYLAGLVSSLVASPVTRNYGRRASIVCGGISFLIGAILNVAAVNLGMLILGRIMLGVGIGFGNQVYNLKPWGWRLSLGLAAAPALLMTVGGLLLPETPNSLIERGRAEEGRRVLERIRGTADVDAEFMDMSEASELANTIKNPFRNILEPRNRPQLVMAVCMPAFQILTGINSILFYAPVLFQTMGFGASASLYSSVITGAVLFLSTLISIATVDRLGRRKLLISGGIQMIVCQVIVAVILGVKFGTDKQLSRSYSIVVVVVICLFVMAFGWSWGPLGWTVPSEIFPLETRSAGQSITVAVNLFFTFVIAQAFLSMLCAFKFGIFLFFAAWITVMTVFVYIFLPETKGVPIEEMVLLWRKHWFWKKVMPDMPLEDGWGEGDAGRADNKGQ
ncbi:hypothetical protein VPH35_090391 [Triticum aestivum]